MEIHNYDTSPNDLEKAARKSAIAPFNLDVDEEHLYEYPYLPIAEQKFIEGAKWQEEQDQETIELAEDHAYLAGAVNEREKILSEAVEGEITKDNRGNNVVSAGVFNKDFEYGDKVRVIVLPKED